MSYYTGSPPCLTSSCTKLSLYPTSRTPSLHPLLCSALPLPLPLPLTAVITLPRGAPLPLPKGPPLPLPATIALSSSTGFFAPASVPLHFSEEAPIHLPTPVDLPFPLTRPTSLQLSGGASAALVVVTAKANRFQAALVRRSSSVGSLPNTDVREGGEESSRVAISLPST